MHVQVYNIYVYIPHIYFSPLVLLPKRMGCFYYGLNFLPQNGICKIQPVVFSFFFDSHIKVYKIQEEIPKFIVNLGFKNFFASVFFPFYGCTCGIWKFLARGQIGAAAASLCHSNSNVRSKPHLQTTPQLMGTPDP